MRPISNPQSALWSPLNRILGTEAAVRVLRVLSLSGDPLSRGEIAAKSGLFRAGIPRVLSVLENQGIVEAIGQGRSRPMRLRQQHPLVQTLRTLFWEEHRRAQQVIEGLRVAVRQLQPPPQAAWIEGPVATSTDVYADPVMIGVLADDTEEAERWRETLRRQMNTLQRQYDVAINVHFWWKADMLTVERTELERLHSVTPLLGPPPLALLGLASESPDKDLATRAFTHELHERTSQQYGKALARLIQRRPSIIDETIQYLERRLPATESREAHELQEWLDMLQSYSPNRLRLFLASTSERATRLRQSAPFAYVLSDADRQRLRQEAQAMASREARA